MTNEFAWKPRARVAHRHDGCSHDHAHRRASVARSVVEQIANHSFETSSIRLHGARTDEFDGRVCTTAPHELSHQSTQVDVLPLEPLGSTFKPEDLEKVLDEGTECCNLLTHNIR